MERGQNEKIMGITKETSSSYWLCVRERKLNSLRPNLLLFLNNSVVELSTVNRLVLGLNPTWRDLIHGFRI